MLLGCPAVAVSQYRERGREFNWPVAQQRLAPLLESLVKQPHPAGTYWNINLPHPPEGAPEPPVCRCELDRQALDVRFQRTETGYLYSGTYQGRPYKPDTDVAHCFSGHITLTALTL